MEVGFGPLLDHYQALRLFRKAHLAPRQQPGYDNSPELRVPPPQGWLDCLRYSLDGLPICVFANFEAPNSIYPARTSKPPVLRL